MDSLILVFFTQPANFVTIFVWIFLLKLTGREIPAPAVEKREQLSISECAEFTASCYFTCVLFCQDGKISNMLTICLKAVETLSIHNVADSGFALAC